MGEKPAIHPDVTVGAALRAVARDVLAEARAALDEPPDAATAVHDYRKAMKRWRALLRLLQPFLGEPGQQMRVQARDLARELAVARDAQASIEALADLLEHETPLSERTIASIRARLEEMRVGAEAENLTQGVRARLMVALDEAAKSVDAWPLDTVSFSDIAREITRTYRRARNDCPKGDWREELPETLHALRGRVVAHRYQMELMEPLWPRFGRLWVAEAQRLRDRLGESQDLSVLQGLTGPHKPLAPWRSRLVPLIAARQAAHAKTAQRMAGRLFAEKPRAFRRRLEALWDNAKR